MRYRRGLSSEGLCKCLMNVRDIDLLKAYRLEDKIVEFCSPTLAGIKTGTLFSYDFSEYKQFEKSMVRVKSVLTKKGIEVIPIRCSEQRALIYIFRPSFLKKDFSDKDISKLLCEFISILG